jgi:dehydrogenase/reductase SDR family protein 7B
VALVCFLSKLYVNLDVFVLAEMDSDTARGYTPEYVSKKMLSAIVDGEKELTVAPVITRLAITIRTLSPSLYFWIMERRARKNSD